MEIDKRTFDEIFRQNHKKVFCFVFWHVKNRDYMLAEDIMQETFAELWDKRAELKEHTNLSAWLTETAKRKMLARWRRASSKEISREMEEERTIDSAIKRLEDEMYLQSLLPPEELKLLKKFHVEGYSQKELADAEGVTEGAMKVKLHRLRRKAQENA